MKRHDQPPFVKESQENTLPLGVAANEGRFFGRLIRGGTRLTPIQQFGAIVLAVPFVLLGVFGTLAGIRDIAAESSWPMRIGNSIALLFAVFLGCVGLRICHNALRPR